jgi:hypothetical protein
MPCRLSSGQDWQNRAAAEDFDVTASHPCPLNPMAALASVIPATALLQEILIRQQISLIL